MIVVSALQLKQSVLLISLTHSGMNVNVNVNHATEVHLVSSEHEIN